MKPLANWVGDLCDRLAFLQRWITAGALPPVFWLSGFFFPQSFLTAVRQNFARRHHVPIDLVAFKYRVLTPAEEAAQSDGAPPPADGALVHGLFLVGARWDAVGGHLAPSRPRELSSPLPTVHLLPEALTAGAVEAGHGGVGGERLYDCPVYKTSERAGTLST